MCKSLVLGGGHHVGCCRKDGSARNTMRSVTQSTSFCLRILGYLALAFVIVVFLYQNHDVRYGSSHRAWFYHEQQHRKVDTSEHGEAVTERLDLDEQQCRATFPYIFSDIDGSVARGTFTFSKSDPDYKGLVQGRIKNNKVHSPAHPPP